MPAKNALKIYSDDSYYHLYNRGVEKRIIFLDEQDSGVFLSYLKDYLLPKDEISLRKKLSDPDTNYKERDQILRILRLNNFFNEITLLAYTLMQNHFHFFVHQKSANSIDRFMQSLLTRYTMYFNHKYKRVGSLFQAVYKAVLVENDNQFIYLSKYIHQQSLATKGETLEAKLIQPSSLPEYLGQRKTDWVHPEKVLSYFSQTKPNFSYQAFMNFNQPEDVLILQDLVIDI